MAYSTVVNPTQLLYAVHSNFGTTYSSVEESWFVYGRFEGQIPARLFSTLSRFIFNSLNTVRQTVLRLCLNIDIAHLVNSFFSVHQSKSYPNTTLQWSTQSTQSVPLGQRFPNIFQVGTTFISQNVLRTTLLLSPLKANCLRFSTTVCDTQFT
jgi:hypothetical protein